MAYGQVAHDHAVRGHRGDVGREEGQEARLAVGHGREGAHVAHQHARPHGRVQVVVGAADVGNAVLHRAKGFDDALGRDAQPVGDAGVQRVLGDGLVGVAFPAAAEDHAAAFRQAQRRHPQALHTLQRKVQKGRKADDARGHAVLRIVLQRRQGAEGVELVLALAHRAQRPKHLGWRRVAHQVLVGVGGAHTQTLVGLVGVDEVVGRRAAGHAARLHHVVHHAPGIADGEGIEKHLRLLPRRA